MSSAGNRQRPHRGGHHARRTHDEALSAEDKVLARYLKPDLLIIDDMGMKQLPKRSGEYLFEVVMRRYETRSTMMTSNRPLEDWGKLLGDVPTATAILDRFLHHAERAPREGMRSLPFNTAASRCATSDLGMRPGSRYRSRPGQPPPRRG
jgi:hypothetical protein